MIAIPAIKTLAITFLVTNSTGRDSLKKPWLTMELEVTAKLGSTAANCNFLLLVDIFIRLLSEAQHKNCK